MRAASAASQPAAAKIAAGVAARRARLYGESPGFAADLALLASAKLAAGQYRAARGLLLRSRPLAVRYLGPRALPVVTNDLLLAQTEAELGNMPAARMILARGAAVVDTLPLPNPLAPQLAVSEALLAFRAGEKPAALRSAARARVGFAALGPSGAYGLQRLSSLEERIHHL